MARATPRRSRPSGPPPRRLTVLYDPDCRLCAFVRGWLARQRQLVPLDLVPVGSEQARSRFPALDHTATRREITVVGDAGQVYRGDSAWLVCLWALAEYRPLSHTLSSGRGRRLARGAVLTAAKYRESAGRNPPRNAAGVPYRVAPGWTYDPVLGWSQTDGTACADGCSPAGRGRSSGPSGHRE